MIIVITSKFVRVLQEAHASAKQSTVDFFTNVKFHPIGAGIEVWNPKNWKFYAISEYAGDRAYRMGDFTKFHSLWKASC